MPANWREVKRYRGGVIYRLLWYSVFFIICSSKTVCAAGNADESVLPDSVYADLEYILSSVTAETDVDPGSVSGIVDFVRAVPVGTSYTLAERDGSKGAFHAFTISRGFSDFITYAFNPAIPTYVTMPSSLQDHRWLLPAVENEHRSMIADREISDSMEQVRVLQGRESETITPDINTGGYYSYEQDRLLWFLPDPAGPILISAAIQDDASDIGKKGCVIGEDGNWEYLFSEEPGLTKGGLGWADTFMYRASSVSIYVSDNASGTIRAGSFKWLNAGWAKINMVKSHHILNGIKRFASDFKSILESQNLPEIEAISDRYQELLSKSAEELRLLVAPYLDTLKRSDKLEQCANGFPGLVTSGEYLEQMGNRELIRIILLKYLKDTLDGDRYGRIGLYANPAPPSPLDS